MTVRGRFTLDTNILIYAIDRDAGERHTRAKAILGRAAERDCVLITQALAEFFHATTRKSLLEPSVAGAFVTDWLEVFPVASANETALSEAITTVAEHHLSFWDAMLWAVAKQIECAAVLTEDLQDGQRLGGVEFINPFARTSEERLAPLMGA